MKKIFSAILLMAAMALSVSTFVSCNDLVDEMESVTATAGENTEAIAKLNKDLSDLQGKLANAETALKAAQAAADAAQAAADAAQDDADKAQAAADAAAKVAAAAATKEQLQEAVNAFNDLKKAYEAKVKELETALAGKVDKATYDAAIKKLTDDLETAKNTLLAKINEKVDQSVYDAKVAEVMGLIGTIQGQIKTLQTFQETATSDIAGNKQAIADLVEDLKDAEDKIWAALNDEETGLEALKELINGNVTKIEGLTTDLATLTGRVKANEDAIKALQDDLATLRSDIANINTNLDFVYAIIKDLASQIQSVTFVPERVKWQATVDDAWTGYYAMPEVDNNIPASFFTIGEAKSELIALATYEVRPIEAARIITDEMVEFSTVALKGENPVFFDAKVIDRDLTTGRILVAGYITEETLAYETLEDAGNVAIALNINVEKKYDKQGVDAGTYVTSSYNLVKLAGDGDDYVIDLTNDLWFAYTAIDTEAGIEAQAEGEETEEVATTTEYTQSYYQAYEMPFDTAIEKSKIENLFKLDDIVVAWGDGYLTREYVENMLGIKIVLEQDERILYFDADDNAVEAAKSPVSIKKNADETNVDGQLVASETYKGGAAAGHYGLAQFNILANGVNTNLYATTQYNVTKTKKTINLGTIELKEWNYLDAEVAKFAEQKLVVTSTEIVNKLMPETTEFKATVDGDDMFLYAAAIVDNDVLNDIKINAFNTVYPKGTAATYTYEAEVEVENTLYTLTIDVKLAPMPADKRFVLEPNPMAVTPLTSAVFAVENINPFTLAIEDIALYDTDVEFDHFLPSEMGYIDYVFGFVNETVAINGKTATGALATMELALDGVEGREISAITFQPAQNYTDLYTVTTSYLICGVQYTFVANVQFEKPAGLEAAITAKDILVNADGTFNLTGYVNETTSKYVLNRVKMMDYLVVSEAAQKLIADGELKIDIACTTTYGTPAKPAATVGTDADRTVKWASDYKATNTYDFVVKLVNATGKDVLCEVKLKGIVEPLVEFNAKAVAATYVNGQGTSTVNIVEGLTVNDLKAETAAAKSLIKAEATEINQWAAEYYDQKVVLDLTKVKAYREATKDVLLVKGTDYEVDAKGNVSLMYVNDADLTSPIIVEVPVELTHVFCPAGKHVGTVMVTFTNANAAE